ncbi:MAG: RDD family protein, partial [Proteobacteria bacterium]|nr:RDD family protein [Pseudomonadota bacterium]
MEKNINKNIFDSGYFYWFIRVIAFCIDYIIIVLISVPIDRFVTNESMSMSMVVILFILYFTFVPHYLGRTIGQFIFGGRMINTSTQQAQEIPKLFFRVLLSLLIFIP